MFRSVLCLERLTAVVRSRRTGVFSPQSSLRHTSRSSQEIECNDPKADTVASSIGSHVLYLFLILFFSTTEPRVLHFRGTAYKVAQLKVLVSQLSPNRRWFAGQESYQDIRC